jgi:hypothetical protein
MPLTRRVESRWAVLTMDGKRRLAVLKSSTPINGIQRPLFPVTVSEANA